jgi:hypothetical protein
LYLIKYLAIRKVSAIKHVTALTNRQWQSLKKCL